MSHIEAMNESIHNVSDIQTNRYEAQLELINSNNFTNQRQIHFDSGVIRKDPSSSLETDLNNSVSDTYVASTFERGFTTSAHIGIVLCTVGICFNLLLIICLCSSKKLRFHYLYSQILSITVADLAFITLVDSFTVYYELHPWSLGPDFCKTWMILDVTLPCVALLALLLLNVDRVLYTYKHQWYQQRMTQTGIHLVLLFTPWCASCTVVCSLWLGFPAVEPLPDVCMYGITLEAHTASSWLTVFLPSMIILVLLIFAFIAVIGEMPAVSHFGSIQLVAMSQVVNTGVVNEDVSSDSSSRNRSVHTGINATVVSGSLTNNVRSKRQRRFVTALLAVDFVSLAITLPFSAFSFVSPKCDPESCDSLMTLFQTLSWMRSSVTCVRPLLFLLLTDIYTSFRESLVRFYLGQPDNSVENFTRENPNEVLILSRIMNRKYSVSRSRNNSTSTTVVVTPPQSPFSTEPPFKTKVSSTFSAAMKSGNDVTFL